MSDEKNKENLQAAPERFRGRHKHERVKTYAERNIC
jgi:hypothetical protein